MRDRIEEDKKAGCIAGIKNTTKNFAKNVPNCCIMLMQGSTGVNLGIENLLARNAPSIATAKICGHE